MDRGRVTVDGNRGMSKEAEFGVIVTIYLCISDAVVVDTEAGTS